MYYIKTGIQSIIIILLAQSIKFVSFVQSEALYYRYGLLIRTNFLTFIEQNDPEEKRRKFMDLMKLRKFKSAEQTHVLNVCLFLSR
jgi:hypothetical protein